MKKHFSIVLTSLLFLLCIVPLVSAIYPFPTPTPTIAHSHVTFFLPSGGSYKTQVNLTQGNYFNGDIEISFNLHIVTSLVNDGTFFIAIQPNGTTIYEDKPDFGTHLTFEAPETGMYTFWFNNTDKFASNKSVTFIYSISSSVPIVNNGAIVNNGTALPSRLNGLIDQLLIYGPIIVIIISLVYATIGLVTRGRIYSERVKNGAIQNPADLEKTIDTKITTINNNASVSEADRKRMIILRCKNAWLSDTTFYYVQSSWKISDMTVASVSKYGVLAIGFKDGKKRKFRLIPLTDAMDSAAGIAVYLSSENSKLPPSELENWAAGIGGIRKLVKNMNQQWAVTINELINGQTQSTQTLN